MDQIVRALPRARAASHRHLQATARRRMVDPGDMVFRQGDPIPVTLMVRGHAVFRRTTTDGRELVLGIAARGMLFGFSGIAGSMATVDLVAVSAAEVALWSGDDFRPLVHDDGGLALDVVDGMAGYIVGISSRLDRFIHQDARQRLLRVLAEYEDLFFADPPVLSRAHLPGLVGTSREMTGRVIRDLERERVIARVGTRGLRLLSPSRLRQAVRHASLGSREAPVP